MGYLGFSLSMKENPRVLWCLGFFRALLNKCRKKSHHKSPSIWMPGSFFPRFFFLLAELTYSGWWRHKIVSFITYDCWLPPKAPPKCNRALSLFSLKSASLYHYCWCISIFLCVRQSANKESNKEYKSHWWPQVMYIVQRLHIFGGYFLLNGRKPFKITQPSGRAFLISR